MNPSKSILLALLLMVAGMSNAQQRTKGVVRWDDDKPAPGALVTVKGTTNTTMTDADGEYEIQTQPGDVLEIIVPYYKIHYAYKAHRLNVWGDLGITIPESQFVRSYSRNGEVRYSNRYGFLCGYDKTTGVWSLPAASVGVGYQYIHGYFLLSLGLELRSMNSVRCYQIDRLNTGGSYDYVPQLKDYKIYTRLENNIYAQVPVMIGFELPHFYWQWGMKVGTALYNGNLTEATNYDWHCLRWGPSTDIGITFGKGPNVPRAQLDQKGKAEYPGRAIVYKVGLTYDCGFNHTVKTDIYGRYFPIDLMDMYLGVKFTACFQGEIIRKERRWR